MLSKLQPDPTKKSTRMLKVGLNKLRLTGKFT
uniref:Uncharacterized protein n=1 Tax=Arundo donax TaxID=35708 RepID=A0A0A9A9A6_ARUDO